MDNIFNKILIKFCFQLKLNGDWGLGIGDWGLGIGPNSQSPIPHPQSPIPHSQILRKIFFLIILIKEGIK